MREHGLGRQPARRRRETEAAEQARHRGHPGQPAVGAHLPARDPTPQHPPHQPAAGREVLDDHQTPGVPGEQHVGVSPAATVQHPDGGRFEARAAQRQDSLAALSSTGRSNYHALNVTLRKRYSHGFQFDLNYTLSESKDLGSNNERGDAFETYGAGGYDSVVLEDSHFADEFKAKRGKVSVDYNYLSPFRANVLLRGFDHVTLQGTNDGFYDKVKVWHTSRDDHFEAQNDGGRLSRSNGGSWDTFLEVVALDFIKLQPTDGEDDAVVGPVEVAYDLVLTDSALPGGW